MPDSLFGLFGEQLSTNPNSCYLFRSAAAPDSRRLFSRASQCPPLCRGRPLNGETHEQYPSPRRMPGLRPVPDHLGGEPPGAAVHRLRGAFRLRRGSYRQRFLRLCARRTAGAAGTRRVVRSDRAQAADRRRAAAVDGGHPGDGALAAPGGARRGAPVARRRHGPGIGHRDGLHERTDGRRGFPHLGQLGDRQHLARLRPRRSTDQSVPAVPGEPGARQLLGPAGTGLRGPGGGGGPAGRGAARARYADAAAAVLSAGSLPYGFSILLAWATVGLVIAVLPSLLAAHGLARWSGSRPSP